MTEDMKPEAIEEQAKQISQDWVCRITKRSRNDSETQSGAVCEDAAAGIPEASSESLPRSMSQTLSQAEAEASTKKVGRLPCKTGFWHQDGEYTEFLLY